MEIKSEQGSERLHTEPARGGGVVGEVSNC